MPRASDHPSQVLAASTTGTGSEQLTPPKKGRTKARRDRQKQRLQEALALASAPSVQQRAQHALPPKPPRPTGQQKLPPTPPPATPKPKVRASSNLRPESQTCHRHLWLTQLNPSFLPFRLVSVAGRFSLAFCVSFRGLRSPLCRRPRFWRGQCFQCLWTPRSAPAPVVKLDLSWTVNVRVLLLLLSHQALAAVHLAPPAALPSRVGASLRSKAFPEGLPDLCPSDLAKVALYDHFFALASTMFCEAFRLGVLATLENPASSHFWQTSAWLHASSSIPTLQFSSLHTCILEHF